MIKRLLAFIFLTLSIGANAAVIEYTLSHVSGDSLTGTFTTDNGVYAGGSVVGNEAQVWSTGNPTRHYYYPYTFGGEVCRGGVGSASDKLNVSCMSLNFDPSLSEQAPSLATWTECLVIDCLFLNNSTYSGVVLVTPSDIPPVPLPAAAWLFISAIAGLAGAKRMSRPKGSAQSLQR